MSSVCCVQSGLSEIDFDLDLNHKLDAAVCACSAFQLAAFNVQVADPSMQWSHNIASWIVFITRGVAQLPVTMLLLCICSARHAPGRLCRLTGM